MKIVIGLLIAALSSWVAALEPVSKTVPSERKENSRPVSSYNKEPLWELGVGSVALHTPHYLGANQQSDIALPFPYFIYRGDFLRADRGGVRGDIYNSEKLDLRISLGGALPVNSDDNDAREGMDDLEAMIEFGPTLQYQLIKTDKYLLRADFPVRAAFRVGSPFLYHQGWTSNPRLYYEREHQQWLLKSTLGPIFSDSRYHAYIYDVNQDEVLTSRPFYQAQSGYSGARFSMGVRRRIDQYIIGANMTYINLDGVENDDSPLLLRENYLSFSLMFAWILKDSGS